MNVNDDTHPRGIDTFREHLRRMLELRTAELIDVARRVGPAARNRPRFLESGTKKLEIDLASIDRLHQKDWELT